MSGSGVHRVVDRIDEGPWIRRSITVSVVLGMPVDALDAALRRLPGRTDYLRHVCSVGFFGRRLAVDVRLGPLHREYGATVTSLAPQRFEWAGPASTGVVEWMSLRGSRSRLSFTLVWEPDSLVGLLLTTVRLDRFLIDAEVRRFARHVEGARGNSGSVAAPTGSARRPREMVEDA